MVTGETAILDSKVIVIDIFAEMKLSVIGNEICFARIKTQFFMVNFLSRNILNIPWKSK